MSKSESDKEDKNMYCRNCGAEMPDNAAVCVKCGVSKGNGDKFCYNCGTETNPEQAICLKCGVSLQKKAGLMGKADTGKTSFSDFKRVSEGKIFGGVCTGLEKNYGINRWISRIAMVLLPLWPIVLIAYILICTKTELE